MSQWTPCKRRDFIRRLRRLGFVGPFSGTRHQFMVFNRLRLTIPSNQEYAIPQLKMMIREIEAVVGYSITAEAWRALR